MKKIVIPILTSLLLCSCEKDDDCKRQGMVQIQETTIPDTVAGGEVVQITVKAAATNLCWSDLYVEVTENETFKYSIQSYGTFACCEGGCACPDAMLYKDTTIAFQPRQQGTYIFNISETENRVVVDTMIVK